LDKRQILPEEIELIKHLLDLAVQEELIEQIPEKVQPYNPKQKESINLSGTDESDYAGDIIRVEYIDTDQIPVTITLTQNSKGEMLDLDFWKEDFKAVINYPSPDKVEIVQ